MEIRLATVRLTVTARPLTMQVCELCSAGPTRLTDAVQVQHVDGPAITFAACERCARAARRMAAGPATVGARTPGPPNAPPPGRQPRPSRRQSHPGALGLIALGGVFLAAVAIALLGLAALSLRDGNSTPASPVAALTPMPTAPIVEQPTAGAPAEANEIPPTLTAPGSLTPDQTSLPSPSVAPTTVSAGPAGLVPAETKRLHYQLIDERRYDEGYDLMSTRLRAQHSRATYQSWFANKVSLNIVSVALVSEDDRQAVVEGVVDTVDREGESTIERRVTERFVLVHEDRGWSIDHVTRL